MEEPAATPVSADSLRVTVVQRASSTDAEPNRSALADVFADGATEPGDLVVWPEADARDFGRPGSPLGEHAETIDGAFGSALADLAEQHRVRLLAGMFERSEDPRRPFNTLIWAGPGGERATYRKIHLYDSFGFKESDVLSAGPIEPVVISLSGFSIGLMTCYDLRFPEMARALVDRGAEVLVVPAAWVAGPGKVEHWRTLARARAIENTAYVVAAAQSGPRYSGHSLVVAPDGTVLAEAGEDDTILTATLERKVLDETRAVNPSLHNRRM